MSLNTETVIAFAAARLVESPGRKIWMRDLYAPYRTWCAQQGLKPLSYVGFAASLRGHLMSQEIDGRLHLLDRVLAS